MSNQLTTDGPASIKSNEPSDDNHRIFASLSFIFVIIVIGLPMWWKTTEVYRVYLPYDGIQKLNNNPIKIVSNIGIFTKDQEKSSLLVNELDKMFAENDILQIKFHQIILNTELIKTALTPAKLERIILENYNLLPGDFMFFEWDKLNEDVLVTSDRTALFSKNTSSMKLQEILRTWILQEYKVRSILKSSKTTTTDRNSRLSSPTPYPQYDVLISVLNPRPDMQNVEWDVRAATERYIQPFLNQISLLSNFTLKSQWKYQVEFDFPSKQIKDDSILGRHYALSEDYLPYIITSIEKKLGNPISDNPCIHLVVYVPPCKTSPLHLYNKLNKKISINNVDSFISQKWGGIVIANPPENTCLDYMNTEERVNVAIKSEDVMQVLLHILRKLVNIECEIPIKNANMVPLDSVLPRAWEIDTYLRNGIVHSITSATITLQSLIQLLGGINNIVINDEVGAAVNEAYRNLVLAKQYLYTNDIHNATIFAKNAFIESEKAFFHPSMLALLYFPDDQKYAIYIPLFLPIMIPVILSMNSIFIYYFKPKSDCDKTKLE